MDNLVSVFKSPIENIVPCEEITLLMVYEVIKSDKYKEITDNVRNGSTDETKILPYITPSGTFSSRKDSGLKQYSGIICIDAGHCDIGLKDSIAGDTFLNPAMIFMSPSGNGLKIHVRINNAMVENHLLYFIAISKYLYDTFQLETDQQLKNFDRACTLCHDAEAYYSNGSIDSEMLLSILPSYQRDEIVSLPPQTDASTKPVVANIPEIHQRPTGELNRIPMVHIRAISALKSDGWQQQGDHWSRPGEDLKNGFGAIFSFDPKDGLWKLTDNGLPLGDKGYTDVGVICLLEFRDDWTSCIRELSAEYLSTEITPLIPIKKSEQPVKIGLLPIEGMPPFIQEYINTCTSVFDTPRDYWAGAAIMATALGIGDKIQLVGRYSNVSNLWMNNIGDVSTGKTEAMDFTLKPFENIDSQAAEFFKTEYDKYQHIESMSTKARKDEGVDRMTEPVCFQYIVKDSTPEALTQIHSINKRGIMIARDELKGMLDDYGRYAKSGEQSNMLSSYNRVRWVTNRKGGGKNSVLEISKPCILIYGGMQPDLIPTLAADSRAENGFLARICHVWPDCTSKPRFNKNRVPDEMVKRWENYILTLISIPQADDIRLSVDAEKLYEDWHNGNAEISDNEPSGYLKGVYGKLDIISLRLAIVIYGMNLHNGRSYSREITGAEMTAALNITEYFRKTALKVFHKLFDNPIGTNTKEVIKFLSGLGHSQNEIAHIVRKTQQYVSKVLNK